jgi:hypothetical protein
MYVNSMMYVCVCVYVCFCHSQKEEWNWVTQIEEHHNSAEAQLHNPIPERKIATKENKRNDIQQPANQ